jgi:hypothetical protein
MKKLLALTLSIFALITVFSTAAVSQTDTSPLFPKKAKPNQTYAYITNITTAKGSTIIHANYISFLTGAEAIAEARKRGDAAVDIDSTGKKRYFVYNDYYIVDDSKSIRKLPLARNVKYDLSASKTMGMEASNNLSSLRKIYKDQIFLLTLKNKEVSHIKQIFVP